MKKTLLAAALLVGFAGAAQAQSNVTLYGLVDAGFNYQKFDGNTTKGIDSGLQGQSRWGIRGTEDIGNGLKALFVLESGYTVDNGASTHNRLFGRYAYVGLESNAAGRLIMGRTTNLAFAWAANVSNPFGLGFSTSSIGTTFGYNDADLGGGRADNAVYYYSPSFSGFQAAAGYSFNIAAPEQVGSSNNNRLMDFGLKYSNGPINAVAAYQIVDPASGADKFKNLTLAASYNFGVATVHAGYANAKDIVTPGGYNRTVGGTFTKDNAYTLGVSAPVGPGKVYAAYQKATKSKVDGFALGYTYDLSKRTNLYAYYSDHEVRNFTAARDMKLRQFALGLQHRF